MSASGGGLVSPEQWRKLNPGKEPNISNATTREYGNLKLGAGDANGGGLCTPEYWRKISG